MMGKPAADFGIAPAPRPAEAHSGRLGLAAWCFYDWANSAFPTVITTFIFAAYFTQAVAATAVEGTILWSRALTVAGLIIAVGSPLLGAVADCWGPRKPWLLFFSGLSIALTGLLWFVKPEPDFVMLALIVYTTAAVTYHFAIVFYDAMLPTIAPPEALGRISGWGWATGYAGGLVCLVACLWIVTTSGVAVFGLDAARSEPVRATAIFVAAWFMVFSLPLFVLTPDRRATGLSLAEASHQGLRRLPETLRLVKGNPAILRFLLAHMAYTDGLVTLFAFGGIFAAAEFGMKPEDILVFGIVLNVAAGVGAAAFAWIDDAIGSRRTIMLALAGLIVSGCGLVLTRDLSVFWALAVLLGVFVGPAQAAGRSMMARLSPPGVETEMFGLYALAGKATAFAGPLCLGLTVQLTGSQRAGLATVVVFLAIGMLLIFTVREPDRAVTAAS